MSFAKAKLQRFNDIKVCTPSPAKYNASAQKKLKYSFFSSKKCSPPCSEINSIQSTPCFQTPNVPKKKKFLGLSASKPKFSQIHLEELKGKTVECNNKDAYIKELIEQIEDMKEKIWHLEKEKDFFEDMKLDYEQKMVQIKVKHKSEFSNVSAKILELHQDLQKIQLEYKQLKEENCLEIAQLFSEIRKFEDLHNQTIEKHKINLEKKKLEYYEKLKELQNQHNQELDALKKQVSLKTQKLEKLVALNRNNELLIKEKDAKIRQLEENFQDITALTEIQLQEKINEIETCWRQKYKLQEDESNAILKECQEISEYNVVQSEFEKSHIKNLLKEKEAAYDNLKSKYDEFVSRYKHLNFDSHHGTAELQAELKKIKKEKRAYEISLHTFSDTIEVLKKRLINSDRDVEQLKDELKEAEAKILNYEAKIGELSSQLNFALENNDELEMQFESTSKRMQQQVKSIEKELLGKVDVLEQQLNSVKSKARDEKALFNEVIEQRYEQQMLTNKAQEMIIHSNALITKLEAEKNELENSNIDLQVQLENAKSKLREELEDSGEIRKKYIEKSGKYDELSQQFEQVLQELERIKSINCDKKYDGGKTKGKKSKYTNGDKENLASPARGLIRVESPGPLKEKN